MPEGQCAGIVGGGIGGLTAAIALRKAGWDVTVYERASEFTEVGAAVVLFPNALAALDEIGVGEQVRANSLPYSSGAIRNLRGQNLVTRRIGDLAGGRDLVTIHRADLIDVLVRALPAECLRTGTRVTGVGCGDHGRAEIVTDGDTARYDLVVAADGVHSVVRQQIWPGEGTVVHTGVSAWRWIVDGPPPDFVGQVWGIRGEFGILPLAGNRTYAFAGAQRGESLAHFADWPEPVSQLVANADPARIIENELLEIRTPKLLTRGKVALIGDAAHAMRPHLGLGAALAIEDAVTRLLAAVRDVVVRLTPDILALSVFGVINRWRPKPIERH
ncbi:FAD-dependent monooxygenase [uncultured Rhodococcus sp.]|uniref:FAD-dependent monooxygenase n=1 Tax=uncultured Rhodococcus sp. TaxID=194249 RepID=UPI0028DBAB59|nr:FAD-dependent monooxygenase [uncultured Rhodococcus sp.]